MHPNDTIYLYHEPQTFLTFGAVGTQQQVPFELGVSRWRRPSAKQAGFSTFKRTQPLSFSIEVKRAM